MLQIHFFFFTQFFIGINPLFHHAEPVAGHNDLVEEHINRDLLGLQAGVARIQHHFTAGPFLTHRHRFLNVTVTAYYLGEAAFYFGEADQVRLGLYRFHHFELGIAAGYFHAALLGKYYRIGFAFYIDDYTYAKFGVAHPRSDPKITVSHITTFVWRKCKAFLMILTIHPSSPDTRKLTQAADILRQGGVLIIPTDTLYAFACSLDQYRAFEKISRLKGVKPEKANFSILCSDLSNISYYTRPFDRHVYKLLNKAFPGPYTFILEASANVPSLFRSRRKTIGIRIPDHPVVMALIRETGQPLVATTLHLDDAIKPHASDPDEIAGDWEDKVDAIIDCGAGHLEPSTIVDCTGDEPVIVRQGAGSAGLLL